MTCLGSQTVRAGARTGAQAPVLSPSFCPILLFWESTASLGGSACSVLWMWGKEMAVSLR